MNVNHSYSQSFLSPIPKLDAIAYTPVIDITHSSSAVANESMRRASSVYQGNGLVAFTKNLERFCTEIVDKLLPNCRQIVIVFVCTQGINNSTYLLTVLSTDYT